MICSWDGFSTDSAWGRHCATRHSSFNTNILHSWTKLSKNISHSWTRITLYLLSRHPRYSSISTDKLYKNYRINVFVCLHIHETILLMGEGGGVAGYWSGSFTSHSALICFRVVQGHALRYLRLQIVHSRAQFSPNIFLNVSERRNGGGGAGCAGHALLCIRH